LSAITPSIVACDFRVVGTARFRALYVFLLMEVGTRRIVSGTGDGRKEVRPRSDP
jgi:hypothetical protein